MVGGVRRRAAVGSIYITPGGLGPPLGKVTHVDEIATNDWSVYVRKDGHHARADR